MSNKNKSMLTQNPWSTVHLFIFLYLLFVCGGVDTEKDKRYIWRPMVPPLGTVGKNIDVGFCKKPLPLWTKSIDVLEVPLGKF